MITYGKNSFGLTMRNITGLTKDSAQQLCDRINCLQPKQIWTNSGCDAYWSIKPTHLAGEGHSWGTGLMNPNAKIETYDGAYLVEYSEVFAADVKTFNK